MDIKIPVILQPQTTPFIKDSLPIHPVAAVPPVPIINSESLNTSAHQQQLLNTTLRHALPHQASPTQLLSHILQNLPALQHDAHLSTDLKALLQNLVQSLPSAPALHHPQTLAQALQNSGLFLEAHLAQSLQNVMPSLQHDFKANLLKLKTALQQPLSPDNIEQLTTDELIALKTLQNDTLGALNGLLLNQLASLPKEDAPKQVWSIEIPYVTPHGTDSFKLEITRDKGHATEAAQTPCWSVTLILTPPELATVSCKMTFESGVLNTYFRSDDPQTLTLIEQQTEQLRTQLTAVGLSCGYIDSQPIPLEKPLSAQRFQQGLFDDTA